MRHLMLLIAALSLAGAPALASPFSGEWQGEVRRGEAVTPIRLHIDEQDGVSVDLPDLIYAWEPAEATADADGLTVKLPFGIGPMPLRLAGEQLTATRGSITLSARRTPAPGFKRSEVAVAVEGASLPVEVYSPTGLKAPAAAVVVAAGSGTADGRMSWSTRSWCDLFVRRGLLCAVYARRPDHGDDGASSTLQGDARDLAAVIAMMKRRPGVDAARLGVFARSRGSWIAAETAGLVPDIRFMILSGTAATTPSDQEIISVVERMTRAGRPAGDIAEAVAYERLYFSVAHTGRDWPALEAAVRRAEQAPWGEFVDQPRTPADLAWWKANGSHDPRAAYRALRMPVLAVWGGDDVVTPPGVHAPLLRELMAANPRAGFRIFADGDHRGEHPLGSGPDGAWRWFGMAPGLLAGLDAWLVEQGLAPARQVSSSEE